MINFKKLRSKRAVSLIELVMAISLLGIFSVGIWSINKFVYFHLFNVSHRAKLQNELTYTSEHISRSLIGAFDRGGAMGDAANQPVTVTSLANGTHIEISVDENRDGYPNDNWLIAYRHFNNNTEANYAQLWYYSKCEDALCSGGGSTTPQVISDKIRNFTFSYPAGANYVELAITGCWDSNQTELACGEPENPQLELELRINMPGVSTN